MLDINKEEFDRNLLLTQTYCELQLQKSFKNNFEVLRSFNPVYHGKPIFVNGPSKRFSPVWRPSGWNIDPLFDDELLYNKLFEQQLLYKQGIVSPSGMTYKGKILIAEIDTSTVDGASDDETGGFIDGYDCPPIDTWFYMTRNKVGRVLFAWIPTRFVGLVNGGIEVNCLDCFGWYDEVKGERTYYSDYLMQKKKSVE